MADYNVDVTPGDGNTVACDEINDVTLGDSLKVQYVKLITGTPGGTTKVRSSDGGSLLVEGGGPVGTTGPLNPVQVGGRVFADIPTPKADGTNDVAWLDRNNRLLTTTALRSQRWQQKVRLTTPSKQLLVTAPDQTWAELLTVVFSNEGWGSLGFSLWSGSAGPELLAVQLVSNSSFVVTFDMASPLHPVDAGVDLYCSMDHATTVGSVWGWGIMTYDAESARRVA